MSFVKQRLLLSLIGLSLLPLIGCGGNSSSGTSEQVSTTSTLSTVVRTTTELTTTTTLSPGRQKDLEIGRLPRLLKNTEERLELIEAIEIGFSGRIDELSFLYAGVPPILNISVSTGTDDLGHQKDTMWELATAVAFLWGPEGLLRNDDGYLEPMAALQVDSVYHEAFYDQMVQLSERKIARSEWMTKTCWGTLGNGEQVKGENC